MLKHAIAHLQYDGLSPLSSGEYCGKDFAYKYNFDCHLRLHTGERRFRFVQNPPDLPTEPPNEPNYLYLLCSPSCNVTLPVSVCSVSALRVVLPGK